MSVNKHLEIECDDEDGYVFFTIRTSGELVELDFSGVAGQVVLTQEMYESFVMAVQEFDNFVTEI